MRIALGVEYIGQKYSGWQTQPDGCAVQDVLEAALTRFAGQSLRTVCAGRTDAGVHAVDQVVHLDTTLQRESLAWVRGVNHFLPDEIGLRWMREVPDDFHARFGAQARRYEYWLLNEPVPAPLLAGRVGWCFRPLDHVAMAHAASALLGRHDFSAFRSAECQASTPIRELQHIDVVRIGTRIKFVFQANAFLHHMVRNLVGTLVYIGTGRRPTSWAGELLIGRDRRFAAPTFSPDGLYLSRVQYDPRFGFPAARDIAFV